MEKAAFQLSRPKPVVDISMLNKLKRKANDSPDASPASAGNAQVMKKWKNAHGEGMPPVTGPLTSTATATATPGTPVAPTVDSVAIAPPTPVSTFKADRSTVAAATPSGKESARSKPTKPAKDSANTVPPVKPARQNAPTNASKPTSNAPSFEDSTMEGCMTRKQQVIEQEFNLAILLKHDELRLIEQELAKCQVALEQLRRCHLVPFPGAKGMSENVSLGAGAALKPLAGYTRPEAPAPWGVTDGPYTRHYARWLIPDAKFDPMPKSSANAYAGMHYYGVEGGRSTRGSFAYDAAVGGKFRNSRTSRDAGLKLSGLGDHTPPAPKIDPLIHKRSTDGQWVKLYCAECKSDKFSNTQGFLNHCRIKHNLVYKSHDAAAIACGIPIDMDEVTQGGTVAVPQTTTTTSTTTTVQPAATPASTVAPPVAGPEGSVHSLIKAAPSAAKSLPPRRVPPPKTITTPGNAGPVDSYFDTPVADPKAVSAGSFVASPQTPYISELLAKRGFSGNLQELLQDARTKIDMDSIESPVSEDESSQTTPITATAPVARLPANFGGIGIRPGSQKGQQLDKVRESSPHVVTHPALPPLQAADNIESEYVERSFDLSPHTMESNPGLVSDCEDDDDEEDDARSVPQMMDIDEPMDIVVEDGSDVESGRRKTLAVHRVHAEADSFCAAKAGSPSRK